MLWNNKFFTIDEQVFLQTPMSRSLHEPFSQIEIEHERHQLEVMIDYKDAMCV